MPKSPEPRPAQQEGQFHSGRKRTDRALQIMLWHFTTLTSKADQPTEDQLLQIVDSTRKLQNWKNKLVPHTYITIDNIRRDIRNLFRDGQPNLAQLTRVLVDAETAGRRISNSKGPVQTHESEASAKAKAGTAIGYD